MGVDACTERRPEPVRWRGLSDGIDEAILSRFEEIAGGRARIMQTSCMRLDSAGSVIHCVRIGYE